MKKNVAHMTSAYDTNQLFETVVNQIKTAIDFADAGRVSFIPKQVTTTAYDLIFFTGYFADSC